MGLLDLLLTKEESAKRKEAELRRIQDAALLKMQKEQKVRELIAKVISENNETKNLYSHAGKIW